MNVKRQDFQLDGAQSFAPMGHMTLTPVEQGPVKRPPFATVNPKSVGECFAGDMTYFLSMQVVTENCPK